MKLEKFRKGQMAIVMTLALATLLGVMALGTDVGVMYYIHMQLQKGADAAAIAGANYLSEDITGESIALTPGFIVNTNCSGDDATKAACTYAINNNMAFDSSSLKIKENVAGMPNPNIQVIATRSGLPYMFGRVIGLSTYTVAAAATATQGSTGSTTGLFPMGMQCTSPCSLSNVTPGSPVTFGAKFSPTVSATGNWQWLSNPAKEGAPGVGDAITSGLPGTYSIGEDLSPKTGSDSMGPISSAFSSRFSPSSCPALSPDPCSGSNPSNIPTNDPCLITVPAVDFTSETGKSLAMPIEGFAQVYVEPGSTSSTINACFVKELDANAVASGGPALGSLGRPELVQ
jgi:Flp pilus assembly protein TadG